MRLVDGLGKVIKHHGRPFPGGKLARRIYRRMNPRKFGRRS